MPLHLSWFERQVFLHRFWGPGPILDGFGILAFQAINASVKLGVFESLETGGPSSTTELARRLGGDEKGLALILEALAATGYVVRNRSGRYRNSGMTRKWMLAGGSAQLGRMFGYFGDAFLRLSDLDEAVKVGGARRPVGFRQWLDAHPGSWDRYHDGLRGVASLVAPRVAAAVKLPKTARRIIDIGGSHGLYSIELCRRYPGLSAVILDRKEAEPVARSTIAEHRMEDRVTFVKGDVMTDEITCGPFDAALVINTLRSFDQERAATLFGRIRRMLNPGGAVLVADQFRLPAQSLFARLNATLILLELYRGGATVYTDRQAADLLRSAGYRNVRTTKLSRTPGIHLLSALTP